MPKLTLNLFVGSFDLVVLHGRKQHGLEEKPRRAKLFYAVIAISTLVGVSINFLHINPISALFWTAVINGFAAPPMLCLIMFISNNRTIMGERG